MTGLTPRPMRTPDLAGILAKPKARSTTISTTPPTAAPPDAVAVETDPPARTSASGAPASMFLVPASTDRADLHADEVGDAEDVSAAAVTRSAASGPEDVRVLDVPTRTYVQQMTVYLPRSLFERLHREAARLGVSRTALMLGSVNATHERLAESLTDEPVPRGALFDVPQARAPKPEPNMQTSIRVTDQQLTVLEALARQNKTTRSKVLAAAIAMHLA